MVAGALQVMRDFTQHFDQDMLLLVFLCEGFLAAVGRKCVVRRSVGGDLRRQHLAVDRGRGKNRRVREYSLRNRRCTPDQVIAGLSGKDH